MYLRWHDSGFKLQKGSPIKSEDKYGEPNFLVLQQWWHDEDGVGEWRDIETECTYDMVKPPKGLRDI